MQRRRFLRVFLISTASVGTAAVGLRAAGGPLYRDLKARYASVFLLPSGSTGSLDRHTGLTLLAVTDVLLAGTPAEGSSRDYYQELFRWNAETRPGYRRLYVDLTTRLDAAARDAGANDFVLANAAIRERTFAEVVAPFVPRTRQEQLRAALFTEDRWLFRVRITDEILQVFTRTDAMKALGYNPWAGLPRGLDDYTRPPA